MTSGFEDDEDVLYIKADRTYLEFCSSEESQTKQRVTLDKILQKNLSLRNQPPISTLVANFLQMAVFCNTWPTE